MRSTERDDLDMNMCLFLGNHANYFGSFYRITKGATRLSSSNVTSSVADECVGAAEAKFGSIDMRYTIIDDSMAKAHNGGFCARMLDSMTLTLCLFARCRHTSAEKSAASALLIYENPYDSSMTGCQFVANKPDRSFTLVVATGHGLVVRKCLFSGPADELSPNNLITEKCLFAQKEFLSISFQSFAGGRYPGYSPGIIFVQRTVPAHTTDPGKRMTVQDRSAMVAVLSLVVSAAVAAALTLLASVAHRMFKAAFKMPRAIQ
jgi:hypothetical protein